MKLRSLFIASTLSTVLASASMLGCSDSPSTAQGGDPNQQEDTRSGGDESVGGLGDIPLTIDEPLDASKSYRFAVVWFQLNDDVPVEPEVVYEAPFDPTATKVSVPPLRAPSEAHLLCARDDNADPSSPCLTDSPFKLGLGLLVIVEDTGEDGKVDLDDIERIGRGAVIYSEKGGDVLPDNADDEPVLIGGPVKAGTTVYESYARDEGFDRLRPRTSPIRFSADGPNLG